MSITRKIPINNDLDIAVARLQAREVAREIGFGTIDQARISLAAGELARILSKQIDEKGEILISGTNANGQLGIQVVCINPQSANATNRETESQEKEMSTALSMVDEYMVEDQGIDGTRVTLKKWLS